VPDLTFVFRNVSVPLEEIREKLALHDLHVVAGNDPGALEALSAVPTRPLKVGDLVWYLCDGKPHSAPILSIRTVENAHDDYAHTSEQKLTYQRFGPSGAAYATVHTELDAKACFVTKEALLASL